SFRLYNVNETAYRTLLIVPDGKPIYFERLLCTRKRPLLFDPGHFESRLSSPKNVIKKEQLSALHGIHRPSGKKWFAWHGLGENQLHFSGEPTWWPKPDDRHAIRFTLPDASQKLTLEQFIELLAELPELPE